MVRYIAPLEIQPAPKRRKVPKGRGSRVKLSTWRGNYTPDEKWRDRDPNVVCSYRTTVEERDGLIAAAMRDGSIRPEMWC